MLNEQSALGYLRRMGLQSQILDLESRQASTDWRGLCGKASPVHEWRVPSACDCSLRAVCALLGLEIDNER